MRRGLRTTCGSGDIHDARPQAESIHVLFERSILQWLHTIRIAAPPRLALAGPMNDVDLVLGKVELVEAPRPIALLHVVPDVEADLLKGRELLARP